MQGDGYAIQVVANSTIVIRNSCFIDNSFVGRGIVLLDTQESLVGESNNYGTSNGNVECEFISARSSGNGTWIEFSSTACLAEKYATLVGL